MKDAVKTGSLSKRWTYMWTFIPNLVYHQYDPWLYHDEFVDSVNQTLVLHDSSKIKNFVINLRYKRRFHSHVDLWVRVATRKRVEELNLNFFDKVDIVPAGSDNPDHYLLPLHLYTNSSITKLSSNYCDFAPSGRFCWASLKILSIGHAKLSEDLIRTILVGSLVLEYLKLNYCEGFNRLENITSQSLRKFVIDGYWFSTGDDDVSEVEILGPNLQSLEISSYFYDRKCRLSKVPCLVDATLKFWGGP